jgi:membrane fusion protein (multidrug efflux system)
VELRDIKVGRDFGTKIEVTGGLNASDKIVNNPADSLGSGAVVRVTSSESQTAANVKQSSKH